MSKKLKFNGLHLSKNYLPSLKTFTDLSNITFNWLAVWKITWGIWQIFTWAFESLKTGILMGSFNRNLKKYDLKSTEELSVMKMKNDPKPKEKLTCHFKVDMRTLANFNLSTWKSQKIFTLMSSFWTKCILF